MALLKNKCTSGEIRKVFLETLKLSLEHFLKLIDILIEA